MSESIYAYDLLMRERGKDFGSNLSIIHCANELADAGFTVYVGVSDLTIPEMKHIVYGYYDGHTNWEIKVTDDPEDVKIIFFNENRIKNVGYAKSLKNVKHCKRVAIIATASTIQFIEEYNLLVKQPEVAVIVYNWNGAIPRGSDNLMAWELDRSGVTLEQLTQRGCPSSVFMDIFEYGITLLTMECINEPRCREIISIMAMIHDSFANKPRIRFNEPRRISIEHDITNDILLIENKKL